jgi:hypothetical protein
MVLTEMPLGMFGAASLPPLQDWELRFVVERFITFQRVIESHSRVSARR